MKKLIAALLFLGAVFSADGVRAQSTCPTIVYGAVLTAGQWNSCFSAKQDVLNYVPINPAGGIMTGKLTTAATTASRSGFNLTPGTAPSSPVNGDLWTTSAGIYVQINGATYAISTGASSIAPGTSGNLTAYTGSASLGPATNLNISGGILTTGTAGTTVGEYCVANATSGTICLLPVTGALGSSVLTLPAATDTIALLAATQTLTNKTINGAALSGTLSGSPTFSGIPLFSGLSSGTCASSLAIDSGNHTIKASCPGAATAVTIGTTTVSSAGGTNEILTSGTVSAGTGTLANTPATADGSGNLAAVNSITGNVIATKSQQISGSSATNVVTPSVQQNHPSAVKAWFTISSSCTTGTCTLGDSYGITSVVFSATGDYTVTFSTAFANTNYAFIGNCQAAGVTNAQCVVNIKAATQTGIPSLKSTTQIEILTGDASTGTPVDTGNWSMAFMGTQ